jgi:rhodanese-related sulfurtransferase
MKTAFFGVAALLLVASSASASDDVFHEFGDPRSPAVLEELIGNARDRFRLIDVRTPAEYDRGHIPTAENIDLRRVAEALADGDRDVPVIVYCRTGGRSGRATRRLEALGYTVVDFGGIVRWNGPIEVTN